MEKILDAIGLQLCGFIFLIFVTILFFLNKNIKSKENLQYILLTLSVFALNIFDIFTIAGYGGVSGLKSVYTILARCYSITCVVFMEILKIYLINKFFANDKKYSGLAKYSVIVGVIVGFILSTMCILFNYTFENSAGDYVIGGSYYDLLFVNSGILVLIIIFILYKKFKEIDTLSVITLFSIIIIFVGLAVFEYILKINIPDDTYFFTTILVLCYFTLENNNYKIFIEAQKTNNEINVLGTKTNNYINDISYDITGHLNNVYLMSEYMKKSPELSDEEKIKAMKFITDEAWNIRYTSNEISRLKVIKEGDK